MESNTKTLDEICGASLNATTNSHEDETKPGNVSMYISIAPEEFTKEEMFWWNKLRLLHCPFSWNDLHEVRSENKTGKCRNRITEIQEQVGELHELDTLEYRKSILNIVLVYEHLKDGDIQKSEAMLFETETLLESSSSPVGVLSKFVTEIKDALCHIVFACRAYMQFYSHDLRGVEHTLSKKIIQFEDLNNTCKAAISGIHATSLMQYGYEGFKMMMKYIRTALSLDPDQGEWYFLLGRCLGKLRRTENSLQVPSEEELEAFKKAVNKSKENPLYMVYLAQTYREAAYKIYRDQRGSKPLSTTKGDNSEMDRESSMLYTKALKLKPDCPHINMRCAIGFIKLPHPYKNLNIAKQCLDKALKQQPDNSMVNHTAAVFYERHKKDATKADFYYVRAGEMGSFGAYMDLLTLRYNHNELGYNPTPDFEIILDKFMDVPCQQETFMQIGTYHLFIKNDIENAFKWWEKVIAHDPDSERLKKHKSTFFHYMTPVNVYEVLCDESRLALQSNGGGPKESLYQQIIAKCKEHHTCIASPLPRRRMVIEEKEKFQLIYQKHVEKEKTRLKHQKQLKKGTQSKRKISAKTKKCEGVEGAA